MDKRLLRLLPPVGELSELTFKLGKAEGLSENTLTDSVRLVLGNLREQILGGEVTSLPPRDNLINLLASDAVTAARTQNEFKLRPVINATGVVLHTNLGRAPLSKKAAQHIYEIASNYSTLEYNINDGTRGSRYCAVEDLITRRTGAEAALVVGNNAASVLLMLTALCKDKEVIVSRGELVEIGGSFRVPDVMQAGGAILREVGTTNKTHLSDFEKAITADCGAFLKVHTSNYKIIGFTGEVSVFQLSALVKKHGIPLLYDLGSGLMDQHAEVLLDEPTVKKALTDGADIVCFSGDKLFGGPQCGILVGKSELIAKLKAHHLLRALRVDKLTLAALEATLRLYADSDSANTKLPVLNMLSATTPELQKKAKALLKILNPALTESKNKFKASVVALDSQVGGGSAPGIDMPSYGVEISSSDITAQSLEKQLRLSFYPIITRIKKDKVLLDVRTIRDDQFFIIADAFAKIT